MGRNYTILLIIMLLVCPGIMAQQVRNLADSQLMMKMDEGVEYMNKGQFALADDLFREVLKNVEVVPADLCFYFGKNSFHLDNLSQSIDWLNKYIELKGTSGRFFDQAVEYIQMAETDLNATQTEAKADELSDSRSQRKQNSINCADVPYVVCPVCKGEGVIIQSGPLGSSVYKPCQHCDESGRMKCEDYKLYLKGQLNP